MKHILVIGAGVIGLSTAYYCARRGHRVTVIDRNPKQRDGCSFGNAGLVVPSHFIPLAAPGMVSLGLKWMFNPESPFYVKPRLDRELLQWGFNFWRASTPRHVERAAPLLRDLNCASRACFEEFAAIPGSDFKFSRNGLLVLCATQHALDEEAKTAERARSLGIPVQTLDAKQTSALDPDVTMSTVGSVYFSGDCHLSPDRFMEALQRQLEILGVSFLWETPTSGFNSRNTRIMSAITSRGELPADEFVLCCGSWSPSIVRDLGLRIPMQAGKGYSLTLQNPRQLPRIPALFAEARVAVTPMCHRLRFGGTMEIAGLNEDVNPARIRGIINSVPRYYPEFAPRDFEGIQPWRGLRPCTPDGLPYLGRTSRYANLSITTGHAMMGLSLGPISGKLIAEVLSDERPSIAIDLLNPDRYA